MYVIRADSQPVRLGTSRTCVDETAHRRGAIAALSYAASHGWSDRMKRGSKARRIVIIDGHPDTSAARYLHALARAYQNGAEGAGHEVRTIAVGALQFPLLRSSEDFQSRRPPAVIGECQEQLAWANHWVILYPLWLGSMPATLKAFLEQVLRPGFAFAPAAKGRFPRKLLRGKSARVVVTMGMPALFYRWYFRAHSLKSLERNILAFCGVSPVRASLVGMVEDLGDARRAAWIRRMQELGRAAR